MPDLHPSRIALGILLQGILVYLQNFLMPSTIITGIYIVVVVIGFVCGILAPLKRSHVLRMISLLSLAFPAWCFFLSLRAWMILFDNSLLVTFLLIVVVGLAGALPHLNNDLSRFMYWEQLHPRTKGGRFVQRFMILATVIWTFIARRGIIIHQRPRFIELTPGFLWYAAILFYIGAVALTFFFVYQSIFVEPTDPRWNEKWSWRWAGLKKRR
ncbi:MAG: hypothetical protein IT310_03225 [Anaerolineales bacterium]|nr:hypothetical protein [Anaerolineales bacterium]